MFFSFLQIIGTVSRPPGLARFGTAQGGGIAALLNVFIDALIIGAGVFALFNFVLAGYGFLAAGNEPKKIEAAWAKIWQSILGLVVASGSFVIAALVGQIIYGNPSFLLSPTIPTP